MDRIITCAVNKVLILENRVVHVQRGVKEVSKREGVTGKSGREVIVGKLKSATSKRDIPLNDTAIEMIKDLCKEFYFGVDSPLIPDEHGEVTRPVNFRKRFYRILTAAGIETKGDRKSTRLNSSHPTTSRMPSSA